MSLSTLASQQVARSVGRIGTASAAAKSDADDGFDLLTKYIPTETITLFVAAMSAKDAIRAVVPVIDAWWLYWAGAVLTPLLLLLVAYGKQRAAGDGACFHWWPYAASLIAFLAWALSVPGLIAETNEPGRILAAFAALFVSTVLAKLEKAFGPTPA